jgi:hypothetical protein
MADNPDPQSTAPSGQSPVDRPRRFWFVSRVVAFCLVTSGLLVFTSGWGVLLTSTLIDMYVESLLGLATAVSLAYIGGSVVDYNGGFGNMFSRNQSGGYQSGGYDGDNAPRG